MTGGITTIQVYQKFEVDALLAAQAASSAAQTAAIATLKTPGNGVITVSEAPLNPLAYGAKGDGATNDDAAFASMIAAAGGSAAHYYLPTRRNFLLANSLQPISGDVWEGGGRSSQLTNNTGDLFSAASGAGVWYQNIFRKFAAKTTSASAGGHLFNLTNCTPVNSDFADLYLTQRTASKSMFVGVAMQDSSIHGGFYQSTDSGGRSVPMISFVDTTTPGGLNDNLIENIRFTDYGSASTWAILWASDSTGQNLANKFRNLNFENPVGGAIRLRASACALIEDIELWDLGATSVNHLISIAWSATNTVKSTAVRVRRIARPSGTLGTGLADVAVEAAGMASNVTVGDIHGLTTGGTSFTIDMQNSASARLFGLSGTVLRLNYTLTRTVKTAAGTGATSAAVTGTSPYAGTYSVTTGTSPTAGDLITLTRVNTTLTVFDATIITPTNAAAAAAGLYVSASTTAGAVTIAAANAPAASTVLTFSYMFVPSAADLGPG